MKGRPITNAAGKAKRKYIVAVLTPQAHRRTAWVMKGGTTDKTRADQAKTPSSPREVRLAEALRANLRRRKAPSRPSDACAVPDAAPDKDAD